MCFHVLILMYTNRKPPMPSLGHPALLSWPYQWLCCCWASQVPPVLHLDRPLFFREERLVSYLEEELPRGSQDFRAGVYHFQILPDRRGALGVFMIQASNHKYCTCNQPLRKQCSSTALSLTSELPVWGAHLLHKIPMHLDVKLDKSFSSGSPGRYSAHTFAFDLSSMYWEESLLG